MNRRYSLVPILVVVFSSLALLQGDEAKYPTQYKTEGIEIAAASEAEKRREQLSPVAAEQYLEKGALAWSRERKCVSCHTNGSYLLTRPALSTYLGSPSKEVREFFISELESFQEQTVAARRKGITPTQLAYLAAGLTQWDRHVSKRLSSEAVEAVQVMLTAQSADGSFQNETCWPPLESSEYHGATVAALAIAGAPVGLTEALSTEEQAGVNRLFQYLQGTEPPHDYARLLKLWVATEKPEILSAAQRRATVKHIRELQNEDGGWSLRTFATPETWGDGTRADRLDAETQSERLASDGHQTGLTTYVLLRSGIPATDPSIRRALDWLEANQRETGRWWTRSLNTDKYHFITYSGTCYPLLALAEAGRLEKVSQP